MPTGPKPSFDVMNRRNFLAGLFALPAAAVAVIKAPRSLPALRINPAWESAPYEISCRGPLASKMQLAIARRIAETNPYLSLVR